MCSVGRKEQWKWCLVLKLPLGRTVFLLSCSQWLEELREVFPPQPTSSPRPEPLRARAVVEAVGGLG